MTEVHYVIGIGRSGTSLLMSLLGAHQNLHTPPENYFNTFFKNAFQNKKSFSAHDISLILRFCHAFHKLQPVVGFTYKLPEEIIKNGFNGSYQDLCELLYRSYIHSSFPDKSAQIIIDKNPSNTLFLRQIKKSNPNAKYVLMVRDYRANILSRKQSIHLLSPSVMFNAIRWKLFTQIALKFKADNPENVIVIRYEDLVNSTQDTLKKIYGFLEVSFEFSEISQKKERSSYKTYKDLKGEGNFKRAEKKYEDLSKPIFKERLEKWKTELSQREIIVADQICSNVGKEFGYNTYSEESRLSLSENIDRMIKTIVVNYYYIKDKITFYVPINYKVKRFEKHVQNILQNRNNMQ